MGFKGIVGFKCTPPPPQPFMLVTGLKDYCLTAWSFLLLRSECRQLDGNSGPQSLKLPDTLFLVMNLTNYRADDNARIQAQRPIKCTVCGLGGVHRERWICTFVNIQCSFWGIVCSDLFFPQMSVCIHKSSLFILFLVLSTALYSSKNPYFIQSVLFVCFPFNIDVDDCMYSMYFYFG